MRMTFSGARRDEHRSINRVHVGVVHGALGKELHEWRPPQVADFVRIKGSGRYAPGQTEAGALADMRRELDDAREARFPGLKAAIRVEKTDGRPIDAALRGRRRSPHRRRPSTRAYEAVRGEEAADRRDHAAGLLRHRRRPSLAGRGMEGIVCGPGGRYNTMPDERVDIADFTDMIRIYMLAILEICG